MKRHLNRSSSILKLAFPIMATMAALLSFQFVDRIMLGHYHSTDLAYYNIAFHPFNTIAGILFGLLMGVLILSAKHYGKKEYKISGKIWKMSLGIHFS